MGRYAVFGMYVDGAANCLGTTDDYMAARATMLRAARQTALEHFVYDFRLGRNVATSSEDGGSAGNASNNLGKGAA